MYRAKRNKNCLVYFFYKTFKFYKYKFGGKSYLLNPKDLLERGRAFSDKEVAEYAGVASFRNYHNYENTKDTTLDFLMSPISEEIINNNTVAEIRAIITPLICCLISILKSGDIRHNSFHNRCAF